MKILGIASGNRYFNIGDVTSKDDWYDSINVVEMIKNINLGDEVEFEFEENKTSEQKILTSIKKIGGAVEESVEEPIKESKEDVASTDTTLPEPTKINTSIPTTGLKYPFEYMKPKTPLESEQIKRLSVLSSVATAITSLTGTIEEDNIIPKMEEIYRKFYEVVSV